MSCMHLWSSFYHLLEQPNLEKAIVLMRDLWLRQNDFIFNKKCVSPYMVLKQAINELEAFHEANALSQHDAKIVHRDSIRWTPLAHTFIKANWDVAVDNKNYSMGINIVIQDSAGEILVYLSASRSLNSQPSLAECWALWRMLELYEELAFQCVLLEGDA